MRVLSRRRFLGGGTRGARSPYGYEQNAALRQEDSPVGRAERVPPTGTRKSASADGVVLSFFLCPRSCEHGAGCGNPVGRALRVPPTGMSTTICLRGRGSPVGRALRVPPTGTRKSALRRWRGADIFLMPALVRARRRA